MVAQAWAAQVGQAPPERTSPAAASGDVKGWGVKGWGADGRGRRVRLIAALVLLALGSVASAGGGLWALRGLEDARRLVEHTYEVIGEAEGLLTALVDAETGQRGYLLTGEARYLGPYQAALRRLGPSFDRLRDLVSDNPAQAALLPDMRAGAEAKLAELAETIARAGAGDAEGALALVRTDAGRRRMDALRATVAGFEAGERRLLADRLALAYDRAALATGLVGLAGLLAVALAGLAGGAVLQVQRAARQRAERALSDEQEHARAILDLSPQVLWTASPDGAIEDFAERWLDWTGLSRQQAMGEGWARAVDPDDLPRMTEAWARAVAAGEPYDVEHRVRLADGSLRWMRSRATPRRDPATGAVLRWYGTTEDIHERREATAALSGSEARLRAAIALAPFPILLHAEDGAILQASQAWQDISGWRWPQDIRTIADWTFHAYGERKDTVRADIDRLYAMDRRVDEGDYVIRTATGGERVWSFASSPVGRDADGRRLVVSMAADVTGLRQAEAALRQALAGQRAVYANAPVGLAAHDRELRFLAVNDRMAAMNGRPAAAHLGRTLHEAMPEFADRVAPLLRRVLETGEPATGIEIETETAAHPGERRRYLAGYYPVRAEDGGIEGVSVAVLDIEAQKQAEAALRDLAATLEGRVEERTRALSDTVTELDAFAYTVSHDLRAPLRGMEGFAQALIEDHAESLGAQGRRYAERIMGAARRMDELIGDLLDYSRLSRAEVEPRRVSLEAAVDAALADLREPLARSGAEVRVEALPEVLGSPPILRQVLANLLGNALKFVGPGRRPEIRVGAAPAGAGRTRLFVEDNGIGVAPEHRDRIFRVFERLHGDSEYLGTGIGLAIVRRGAERLGGAAGVEPRPDGAPGSRFWVELPAVPVGAGEGTA